MMILPISSGDRTILSKPFHAYVRALLENCFSGMESPPQTSCSRNRVCPKKVYRCAITILRHRPCLTWTSSIYFRIQFCCAFRSNCWTISLKVIFRVLFSSSTHKSTRGQFRFKLSAKKCSFNITENVFLDEVLVVWNSPSHEVVSTDTFSRFKS